MSRYLLQDLIFVREHREDKASKAVTVASRLVQEAEKALEQKKKEHADYHAWRLTEEERLIQSIMRKPVKVGDITDLRLEISLMREREMALLDQVNKAEGELDRARLALEEAKAVHRKATQDLEKLVEHRTQWQAEQRLDAERLEDLEMEDFHGRSATNLNPEGSSYELN